ncbi:MAG: DNA-protecting protein DprA [Planctomycetes bacterium]|nr:DNA-protecting protein DprA [Planctomycetota bacterium]
MARLALARARGLGLMAAWRLIATFGSAAAAMDLARRAPEALSLPAAVAESLRTAAWQEAEREVAVARSEGLQWHFPKLDRAASELNEIAGPPLVLAIAGKRELLDGGGPRVAIVGARTATPYGAQQSRRFSAALSENGVTVVSGFARGIDREAHRAALDVQGKTLGVLGSGLLEPYPVDDRELLGRMRERGCLLSEFPLRAGARREHFPRRNRVISGLSRGVLVVEAGRASGSLLTARWALDQDRDLWVLPGRVDSPMSAGCHDLLKQGAAIVDSPQDVLSDLGLVVVPRSASGRRVQGSAGGVLELGEPSVKRLLLDRARGGATLEELSDACAGHEEALFGALLQLEMAGEISRGPGGYYYAVEGPVGRAP